MRNLILFAALAAFPAVAFGQSPAPAAKFACEGRLTTVRVSEIPATGTVEGFLAAVAAHKAWYASHGTKDEIFASPMVVRDEKTRERSYSKTQFMTFHVSSNSAQPDHDAAYDAFVKLYRANSVIKSENSICLPNFPQK
jgi:hypothetical protein